MPQMSPYSWIMTIFMTSILLNLIKVSLFFEKKF